MFLVVDAILNMLAFPMCCPGLFFCSCKHPESMISVERGLKPAMELPMIHRLTQWRMTYLVDIEETSLPR